MPIEDPPGFVVRTEAQKAAWDNGYRLERGMEAGWLRYASTTAPGTVWIAGTSPHGPWLLSIDHSGVAAEIRGERNDVFRTRQSSLDLHLPWLDDQWASGCRNGAELWRRLKARGFRGSLRVISEWATRRRRAEKADAQNL